MICSVVARQPACLKSSVRRWLSSTPTSTSKSTSTSTLSSSEFRPRRRPNRNYRPIKPQGIVTYRGPDGIGSPRSPTAFEIGNYEEGWDDLERTYGPFISQMMRSNDRDHRHGGNYGTEDYLRMADYMTAASGSLEERVLERRGLERDLWEDENREDFLKNLDEVVEEERINIQNFDKLDFEEDQAEDDADAKNAKFWEKEELDENGEPIDDSQLAHGEWGEMVVRVDRVQKVQRGGTVVSYRALVIGGNTNGCAGFGIAKANSPSTATNAATRMCKRNIFFIDRYEGKALTKDLVGRQNSCRVVLRAVPPNRGLHGHPLINDILLFFGVTDCTSKSYGNRNQYSVVRATFKAIMTHESLEDESLKRGKRLVNIQQAKRLQI